MGKDRKKPHFGPADDGTPDGYVAALKGLERVAFMQAKLEALRMKHLLNLYASVTDSAESYSEMRLRGALMEAAKNLHISDRTLNKQLGVAVLLSQDFGHVFEKVETGAITYRIAEVIAEESLGLREFYDCKTCKVEPGGMPVVGSACVCGYVAEQKKVCSEALRTYEKRMVVEAERPGMTPAKIIRIARRVRESLSSIPIEESHAEQVANAQFYGFKQNAVSDNCIETSFITDALSAAAIASRIKKIARLKQLELKEAATGGTSTGGTALEVAPQQVNAHSNEQAPVVVIDDIRGDAEIPSIGQLQCETATEMILGTLDTGYRQVMGEVKITVPALTLETGISRHSLKEIQERIKLLLLQQTDSERSDATGLATITGLSGHAVLDGHGPVPAGGPGFGSEIFTTAVLNGSWSRIYVDPFKAMPLQTDSYQPTAAMRRVLEVRDTTCRFTGCGGKAERADADHTIPWQENAGSKEESGGRTEISNISLLCRRHHMGKHHSGWGLKQLGDGVLEWTAPSGRKYVEHPDSGYPQTPKIGPPKQGSPKPDETELENKPPPF